MRPPAKRAKPAVRKDLFGAKRAEFSPDSLFRQRAGKARREQARACVGSDEASAETGRVGRTRGVHGCASRRQGEKRRPGPCPPRGRSLDGQDPDDREREAVVGVAASARQALEPLRRRRPMNTTTATARTAIPTGSQNWLTRLRICSPAVGGAGGLASAGASAAT